MHRMPKSPLRCDFVTGDGSVKRKVKMKILISILAILLWPVFVNADKLPHGVTSIHFKSDPGPVVKVTPMYPESALAKNQEGTVTIKFVIGSDGKATDIEVLNSAYKPLEKPAIIAVQKAFYFPKYSGKSVTAVAEFALNK